MVSGSYRLLDSPSSWITEPPIQTFPRGPRHRRPGATLRSSHTGYLALNNGGLTVVNGSGRARGPLPRGVRDPPRVRHETDAPRVRSLAGRVSTGPDTEGDPCERAFLAGLPRGVGRWSGGGASPDPSARAAKPPTAAISQARAEADRAPAGGMVSAFLAGPSGAGRRIACARDHSSRMHPFTRPSSAAAGNTRRALRVVAAIVVGLLATPNPVRAIHRSTPFLVRLSNYPGGNSSHPSARGEPGQVAFES